MGEAWGRHRRRLASFALLTAIFVGGIAAISSIGVERRPYRAAVPLWDLAVLSLMRHEMLIPEYAIHPPGLEIARLRAITRAWRCDFYDHADGLNVTTDMQYTNLTHLEADRLIRDWLVTITRHPGAYAAHRWRISRRLFSDPMMKLHHRMESIPSFRLPFRFERRPGYEPVHRMLKGATRTLLYEPWLYLLLALAALAVSVATPGAEARLARALASSGLLSVIHLPVTAPSIDFRYSIWLIAAGLIAWLLLARALGTRVLASR
jgi:hypothetical protein